ncbi:VanZ family protein [Austwickia sp. TVS 96-490-7B]|uniref:VanZ family protein n=1 Tax=Austwickia sp. TVS 96-490-7B TaxID=2830843 RepID=UPI002103140C|nr:VanZ family protein [Austwickia sp. TVS 96-490-7B]
MRSSTKSVPAGRSGRGLDRQVLAVATLMVVVGAHLWALYTPSVGGPPLFPGVDKVVHVVLFAVPVLAAAGVWRRWWWGAVICAIHAPVSEIVQALWVPGRSGDPWDAVADLVGVSLASTALAWWGSRVAVKAPQSRW